MAIASLVPRLVGGWPCTSLGMMRIGCSKPSGRLGFGRTTFKGRPIFVYKYGTIIYRCSIRFELLSQCHALISDRHTTKSIHNLKEEL